MTRKMQSYRGFRVEYDSEGYVAYDNSSDRPIVTAKTRVDLERAIDDVCNQVIHPRETHTRPSEKQATGAEVAVQLMQNAQALTKYEQHYKDAIGGLSNVRRTAVYDYVRLLQERIRLVEQAREQDAEQFMAQQPKEG